MRIVLPLLLLLATSAFSQSDVVFETEYDVVLTIGENQYQSQNAARVKNNGVIAIEFEEHKVELRVSLLDAGKFIVETLIFDSVEENWVRMEDDESGGFGGGIGSFSSFNWNGDGIRLNMAITVSIAN